MIDPVSLQKHSLFGGLSVEDIAKILPLMDQAEYSAGETIIVEGETNDKIRFILEGKVAAVKGGLVLCELAEGTVFGEMEVLDVMPSTASIKALSFTKVLALSNRGLRGIYKENTKIFAMLVMNLARDLSRRLRQMNDKVASESPFMEWS